MHIGSISIAATVNQAKHDISKDHKDPSLNPNIGIDTDSARSVANSSKVTPINETVKTGGKTSDSVDETSKDHSGEKSSATASDTQRNVLQLSDADLRVLAELKARDREVRAHEQAHLSAAGSLARGGASYTYVRGPDGNRYASGGEVGIDTSKAKDPKATLLKAQQIRRAAMAPANPSGQDRQVAARAMMMEQQARIEIAELAVGEQSTVSQTNKEANLSEKPVDEVSTGTEKSLTPENKNKQQSQIYRDISEILSATKSNSALHTRQIDVFA